MVLLDTHVWWWSLTEPEYLSKTALESPHPGLLPEGEGGNGKVNNI